jgi:hypothetical protein
MRELKYPCTCSSSIERLNCKENCDHVTQKQSVKIKPKTMIPFDLEKFKQGAVAVDIFDRDVTFHYVCNDEYLGYSFIKDGEKWNGSLPLESALKRWHMKPPPKWIVFREFDSKDEAKEYAEFFGLTKAIWKIEKR